MSESDDRRDDHALQEYLEGRSPVSARYRAISRERVPPALDEAVLGAARAVLPRPAPPRRSWQQRWAVPVGIAATLVVGLDLGWRVRDSVRTEQAVADQAVAELAAAPAASPPAATPVPERVAASEAGSAAVMAVPGPSAAQTVAAPPAAPQAEERLPAASGADAAAVTSAEAESAAPLAEPPSSEAAAELPLADTGDAFAAGDAAPSSEAPPPEALASEDRQAAARASTGMDLRRQKSQAREQIAQALAAPAPPPPLEPPPPRRSTEEARVAAEDLADLLRREQDERLRQRFAASLPRQALRDAAAVMAVGLTPRLSAEADGRWRVDYLDARQQMRCTARLRPTTEGWALEGLVTRP